MSGEPTYRALGLPLVYHANCGIANRFTAQASIEGITDAALKSLLR